jgi:osmotically-inducible protein OsmY
MATASLTDSDVRVRDTVMRQLEWDPEVDASAIGVAASGGMVTLTGFIDTYAGKLAAERAAKRVRGVRAVANDIDVRLRLERTDADIAADVARALELRASVPATVQASVRAGQVMLTGRVSWPFQKREAEKAVRQIRGVRQVLNHLTLEPRGLERDVRHRIVEALHRNASLDAAHIGVTVSGSRAVLTGSVASWPQRDSAERAVADAPGHHRGREPHRRGAPVDRGRPGRDLLKHHASLSSRKWGRGPCRRFTICWLIWNAS